MYLTARLFAAVSVLLCAVLIVTAAGDLFDRIVLAVTAVGVVIAVEVRIWIGKRTEESE